MILVWKHSAKLSFFIRHENPVVARFREWTAHLVRIVTRYTV